MSGAGRARNAGCVSDASHASDAVSVLVGIVRRHIDQLRYGDQTCAPTFDMLRQYRDYGFGLLGMLAGYCDATGVKCAECVRLALELQAAIDDVGKRSRPLREGPRGALRHPHRRT